jgi:hypothetical protein
MLALLHLFKKYLNIFDKAQPSYLQRCHEKGHLLQQILEEQQFCWFMYKLYRHKLYREQIVSAQIVSAQTVSAQFVSDTNCIGHNLYRTQIVLGTNCIGHKLYRAQILYSWAFCSHKIESYI